MIAGFTLYAVGVEWLLIFSIVLVIAAVCVVALRTILRRRAFLRAGQRHAKCGHCGHSIHRQISRHCHKCGSNLRVVGIEY